MEEQKENKALPAAPSNKTEKMVKVKIRTQRAITGYGKAGDVVEMPESIAQQFERDGYVVILK